MPNLLKNKQKFLDFPSTESHRSITSVLLKYSVVWP